MKFTTGRPKPRFAKPLPVIVKLAGGVARSIELDGKRVASGKGGDLGGGRIVKKKRLKVGAVPVCCQTWAWTGPADSPGRFGVIAVAGVGKGTVSVVPVRAVARACASSVVPRMKFTIGRPKPRFVKPLPVIVKLAGGVARSIELGVMSLTPGTVTVTVSAALP